MCIVNLDKNMWKADMLDGGGVVLPLLTSVARPGSCLRQKYAVKDDSLSDN